MTFKTTLPGIFIGAVSICILLVIGWSNQTTPFNKVILIMLISGMSIFLWKTYYAVKQEEIRKREKKDVLKISGAAVVAESKPEALGSDLSEIEKEYTISRKSYYEQIFILVIIVICFPAAILLIANMLGVDIFFKQIGEVGFSASFSDTKNFVGTIFKIMVQEQSVVYALCVMAGIFAGLLIIPFMLIAVFKALIYEAGTPYKVRVEKGTIFFKSLLGVQCIPIGVIRNIENEKSNYASLYYLEKGFLKAIRITNSIIDVEELKEYMKAAVRMNNIE